MKELNRYNVLVTRPEQQADHFIEMIEANNGIALNLPTIEIAASPVSEQIKTSLTNLSQMNIAIFVSVNAVEFGLKALKSLNLNFPENLIVAAVGPSTANALTENNIQVDIVPDQDFSSEGLLDTPDMEDIAGEKIILFRGQSGREMLSSKLTQRFAQVESIDCYQRGIPDIDINPVIKGLKSGSVDAVTVTSAGSVQNLFEMLGKGSHYLVNVPFVVASQRIAEVCENYGVTKINVADNAGDKAMLQALSDLANAVTIPDSSTQEDLEEEEIE